MSCLMGASLTEREKLNVSRDFCEQLSEPPELSELSEPFCGGCNRPRDRSDDRQMLRF